MILGELLSSPPKKYKRLDKLWKPSLLNWGKCTLSFTTCIAGCVSSWAFLGASAQLTRESSCFPWSSNAQRTCWFSSGCACLWDGWVGRGLWWNDGVVPLTCTAPPRPPAHVHQRRELSGILSKPCCSKQREVFLLSFSHYLVCVMLTVFFIYLPHIKIAMTIYRCIPRDRPFCVFKNKE